MSEKIILRLTILATNDIDFSKIISIIFHMNISLGTFQSSYFLQIFF